MTTSKLKKTASEHDIQTRIDSQCIRFRRLLVIMLTVIAVMAICMAPAFASPVQDIEQGLKMGLGQIYKLITIIVVPVAAVCLGFAAFNVFFNGSKGMDVAKKTVIYVGIGVAIAYLAPLIIKTISDWFSGIGDQGIFD